MNYGLHAKSDPLFLYVLWAKNHFYMFKVLFSYLWKLYEIQILVSINTVLLGYRHAHSLVYCLWLHSPTMQNWVVATEMMWPTKSRTFTIWLFIIKVCQSLACRISSNFLAFYHISYVIWPLVIFLPQLFPYKSSTMLIFLSFGNWAFLLLLCSSCGFCL